jgi:hypothetical protein
MSGPEHIIRIVQIESETSETIMEVFKDLFADSYGLLTLIVVLMTLAIPIVFFIMFVIKSGGKE